MILMASKQIVLVFGREFSEQEINIALGLDERDIIWQALMQVIEQQKQEAIRGAASAVAANNKDSAIGEVCGWDHLDALQRELLSRREKGVAIKSV